MAPTSLPFFCLAHLPSEAQNLGKQPPALQLQLPKLNKNSCHPGNLLVQNLDMTIDDGALTIAFEKYGELLSVKVCCSPHPLHFLAVFLHLVFLHW